MSPVEMWGISYRSWNSSAWVPLPAPGGPMKTRFMRRPSLHEPFVVAHQHVGLDLLHRLQGDAYDDQERGPGEVERQLSRKPPQGDRAHRDQPEEERPDEGQPFQDLGQVAGGRPPGTDA